MSPKKKNVFYRQAEKKRGSSASSASSVDGVVQKRHREINSPKKPLLVKSDLYIGMFCWWCGGTGSWHSHDTVDYSLISDIVIIMLYYAALFCYRLFWLPAFPHLFKSRLNIQFSPWCYQSDATYYQYQGLVVTTFRERWAFFCF